MTAYVLQGDCLAVLRTMPDACIDAVVTDPPYGLSKEPDMAEVVRHWCAAELSTHAYKVAREWYGEQLRAHAAAELSGWWPSLDAAQLGAMVDRLLPLSMLERMATAMFPDATYTHGGSGFMGKTWDSFVPGPEVWREVLRVLKPGGHALVFSGTRTYDLTVLAMRIAGFEIRDQLAWMYGSGFPKSLDVSKAIDAAAGAVREVIGTAADFARDGAVRKTDQSHVAPAQSAYGEYADRWSQPVTRAATPEAAAWSGWGTALKPAQEPIVLARKPLIGTVAANVLAHGTGAINVDGCRIGWRDDADKAAGRPASYAHAHEGFEGKSFAIADRSHRDPVAEQAAGRWPANVLLDEVAAAALDEQSGYLRDGVAVKSGTPVGKKCDASSYNLGNTGEDRTYRNGTNSGGGASRFFYCAKTSRAEREAGLDHLPIRSGGELTDREDGSDGLNSPRAGAGRGGGRRNHHPTVKPIALMRYLVRLVTPPGGVVLDPYNGSGTTGCAAVLEDLHYIGIELTPDYIPIAMARIAWWHAFGRGLTDD